MKNNKDWIERATKNRQHFEEARLVINTTEDLLELVETVNVDMSILEIFTHEEDDDISLSQIASLAFGLGKRAEVVFTDLPEKP